MLTYYEDHIEKAVTICQGVALGLPKIKEVDEIDSTPKEFSLWSLLVIPDPAPSFQTISYHNQTSITAFLTHRAVPVESECEPVVNRMVYTTMAIIGTIFVVIYIVVAFSLKRFGKRTVFCEYYFNSHTLNRFILFLIKHFCSYLDSSQCDRLVYSHLDKVLLFEYVFPVVSVVGSKLWQLHFSDFS